MQEASASQGVYLLVAERDIIKERGTKPSCTDFELMKVITRASHKRNMIGCDWSYCGRCTLIFNFRMDQGLQILKR